MSLTVTTAEAVFQFSGPFTSTDDLEEKSGVYVVTTAMPSGKHRVLDVGESGDVQERVATHDRADCWKSSVQDGIYYSAYYCEEKERMRIERAVRDFHNPPCGEK